MDHSPDAIEQANNSFYITLQAHTNRHLYFVPVVDPLDKVVLHTYVPCTSYHTIPYHSYPRQPYQYHNRRSMSALSRERTVQTYYGVVRLLLGVSYDVRSFMRTLYVVGVCTEYVLYMA